MAHMHCTYSMQHSKKVFPTFTLFGTIYFQITLLKGLLYLCIHTEVQNTAGFYFFKPRLSND